MPLAGQPVHQRFVRPGPLVLGSTLLKSPTPTADRDRTVSRRSEPRSRTALMGEQPNPWDLLQPQDATIRHRGAKPPRRCGVLQSLAAQTIPSSLSRCVACYGRDKFAVAGSASIDLTVRSVVTGSNVQPSRASSTVVTRLASRRRLPSVLPLPVGVSPI